MTTTTDRPRPRMLDRLTDPLAERARDRFERAEDKLRAAVQHELDAVGASMRTRAVRIRPSAIAFAAAALLTVIGITLFAFAAVVGVAQALPLWLSALLVGITLVLLAAGAAAWGRAMLPAGNPVIPVPPSTHPAEELVHPWAD
ncbi:phage holin family protein [Cellulomonas dongxiuzhuiae]|uniref:Phage holin family protein n=1 Tax=Cellulomonas dongxiuzhuiae TaxID=2819979 RepID=A0ABX8GJS3_9CELL|nr:phage holin family protein [Cellulomonas dongxiuzhuiae]MBO3088194.1 phage holin family protein [Cellulomonas dongxiuzhuiae]MBO3094459.1 phage holin family protein [Cellulomonas dongxiuzhuiae]QWC15484.1 phage holin family protein [Cellulomonas dongxiuzhuiae]